MRGNLQRVLELQGEYESRASPAMQERGLLIRKSIPNWINGHAVNLGEALLVDDFFAEGRDGTGRKTRVPWVRFGSRSRSPRATEGFYIVFLFDALGTAVYLSINQGTTDFQGGEFVPKPREVITERTNWARSVLAPWMDRLDGAAADIALNDPHLGAGYELGNVAAMAYQRDHIPSNAVIASDTQNFAKGLGILLQAHSSGPIPREQPELREAEDAALRASGKSGSASRAGFRTDSREIKVIETHAVAVARTYYEAQGFQVKELGKPFDLETKKDNLVLTVEVKGTTSDGSGVSLTAGEVSHHAAAFPNNALVVVRNIVLQRGDYPSASGGWLYELRRWDIDPAALRTISYAYTVPAEMYEHKGVSTESLLPPEDP